jgi:cytochrome c biogenesis protein CcmG/thiol:disulfide interchange protein DsbE
LNVTRVLAFIPLVAILAAAILFAGYSLHRDPKIVPTAMVGHPAPTAVRPLINGPTLVNFYASWCGPCAEESPALMALKAEGVRIVGVAYEDRPENTQGFLRRYGDPYAAVVMDPEGRTGVDFGVTGVPETYAVDAAGIIRAKAATPITAADAEDLLAKARR